VKWTAYQASPDIIGGVSVFMRGLRFVGSCTVCSNSCLSDSAVVSSVKASLLSARVVLFLSSR